MIEPDYYEVLQVSPKAEPDLIEAAYRHLARKYHPDLNPDPQNVHRMRALNQARDVLSDPEKRAAYDLRRLRTTPLAARPLVRRTAIPRVHKRGPLPRFALLMLVVAIAVILYLVYTWDDDDSGVAASAPAIPASILVGGLSAVDYAGVSTFVRSERIVSR